MARPPRIGILGGTFDPPHFGHLGVALDVSHRLRLDRMLMVVANDPWQKTSVNEVTPAVTRLALVEIACAPLVALEASDIEIVRGGESYTAETLEDVTELEPDAELFLVIGSDAAEGLDTWKRPDAVRDLATTVVVDRGGRPGGRPPQGWPHLVVQVPSLEISSSDVRARFSDGRPIEALVPQEVATEIRARGLYGSRR